MSISSLLGKHFSFAFRTDIQARPQSRCSSQSDDIESDSQAQEYQHYQHNHGHNHEHSHDLNHDRIRRYHHHDDGPETEIAAADISSQSRHHQHHHHEQALQPHSGDMAHRHHHHIPHQHHQHLPAHQYPHGHVHHHHPQLAAHQHQHTHQHPLPPHHHHHHVHHHHLHHGKSASPASAFSYMPKSLGLRLNPKLKVNATQVYISYLIQLDQMQRAQHLMRSSEKRKSVHDAVATQAKSSDVIPHKHHHRVHSRTPSSGEPSRDVQVISIPDEEIGERDTRPCSPLSDASGERKKRHSQRLEEADMAPGDNGSHQVVTLGNSERISRQGPTHTHLPSRHQHQGQHPHVHAHAHAHAHHSAPVLPVHIHPAQHHHHIVPSTAKLDRGASKANGSQNVHRHHALHHHHPHHHPYHPNHPNHQHHFHHHPHPASHNHSHNHHPHGYALMHGHNHAHARHTHAHNHGGHVHTHAHNHSPSHDNNSPVPERTHRERGHSRGDSQKLALPAPNYSSKSDLMPAIPSITAASPSTPPAQRHDRLSDADVDKDEQCAGRDRAVSRDDGVAGQGKDMEIEDSRKQQQESGASSPPRPALVDPIPTLESAENAMILD
ncbi:hypothetical protein EDD21DRAFT_153840 [Dissophora ornata]|nr:hypothetical protein EDD21DRAFT_153840 [Dissophora ornata]